MNQATGIEGDAPDEVAVERDNENVVQSITVQSQHLRLTQVVLSDVTDRHNELVQEREWLLHPSERELSLRGNLFVVDNLVKGLGRILVKRAPLPHARPASADRDLVVRPIKVGGFAFDLFEASGVVENAWTILDYAGGVIERSRVLHRWQAQHRPATPSHTIPRFISNTWGDRSRDSRIQQAFLEAEIDAAHKLGVDVVQIDDGWEQGVTTNSSLAKVQGGVWEGFWNADPNFWNPHPERFPNGLQPVLDRVHSLGMNLGLWFAPDSWNDFENWERDADTILGFYRSLGIEHIKIDGVKAHTDTAIANLKRFFSAVEEGSQGNVIFDLDVTAEVRPGYFGAMEVGPLFVENRYTDFHNYWPHQTLRNLWMLSRWIDPRRLRMEFLNNTRNAESYSGDDLAPEHYDPCTLFASVMFANPLGWFEVSNLSEGYSESVSALVSVWKAHREALFGGTIVPLGSTPDGRSYTGFLSISDEMDRGFAIVFRGRTKVDLEAIEVDGMDMGGFTWEILASNCGGGIESNEGKIGVVIPEDLGYVFGKFTRAD